MLKRLKERIASWFRVQRRMYSIYCELGYVPWRKPARPKTRKKKDGTYLGGRELIPFMNDDAKRTFSHLLLRPGYMMRDYILRGQHTAGAEYCLAGEYVVAAENEVHARHTRLQDADGSVPVIFGVFDHHRAVTALRDPL